MDYLTEIIDCKTNIDNKSLQLSSNLSSLFLSDDRLTSSTLNTTLIINNHSNMFVKNCTLSSTYKLDQKSINIINTNQSKLYGVNLNLP